MDYIQLGAVIEAIDRNTAMLGQIAAYLGQLAAGEQDPDRAPDLQADLATFRTFDWATIGARIVAADEDGATVVSYNGKNFKRRAPDNAYDPAVWFSRCIGKAQDGTNEYVRLVTFRPIKPDDVQPLGRKAERALGAGRPVPPTPAKAPPASPLPGDSPARAAVELAVAEDAARADKRFDDLPSEGERQRNEQAARAAAEAERKAGTPVVQGRLPGTARADSGGPQNGHLPALPPTGPAFVDWNRRSADFAAHHPAYQRDGQPDRQHMLYSLGSLGYAGQRLTAENLEDAFAKLHDHARLAGVTA